MAQAIFLKLKWTQEQNKLTDRIKEIVEIIIILRDTRSLCKQRCTGGPSGLLLYALHSSVSFPRGIERSIDLPGRLRNVQ